MKEKNGFTLVELLLTISMLAVIGSIIIYNTIGLTNDTKDLQYERMIDNIKNATKTYVSLYPSQFADLYSSKAFTYVKLSAVVEAGLLDEDTTNPYTKEKIDLNDVVKVYIDGDLYEMVYVYPVSEEEKNKSVWLTTNTLTAEVNNYSIVTSANYFYIFDGIYKSYSTTALSLVDEQGQLIQDFSTAGYQSVLGYYKEVYKFQVTSIPSSFKQCENKSECETALDKISDLLSGKEYTDFYRPTKAGTYYITYSWQVPGTKTVKSAKRKVIVVDQSDAAKEKEKTAATTTKAGEEDKSNVLYDLEKPATLNGSYAIPTYVELFSEDISWSIDFVGSIQAPTTNTYNDKYLFEIPNEKSASNITVRHYYTTLKAYYPNGGYLSRTISYGKKIRVVVTHQKGENLVKFTIYPDYENAPTTVVTGQYNYTYNISNKTVSIGGHVNESNTASTTFENCIIGTVYKFTIYNKVIEL